VFNKEVLEYLKKELQVFDQKYKVSRLDQDQDLWLQRYAIERRILLTEDVIYLNNLKRELETGLKKKELTCTYTPPLFDGPLQVGCRLDCHDQDGKTCQVRIDDEKGLIFKD
jgi:hypothetical protein